MALREVDEWVCLILLQVEIDAEADKERRAVVSAGFPSGRF